MIKPKTEKEWNEWIATEVMGWHASKGGVWWMGPLDKDDLEEFMFVQMDWNPNSDLNHWKLVMQKLSEISNLKPCGELMNLIQEKTGYPSPHSGAGLFCSNKYPLSFSQQDEHRVNPRVVSEPGSKGMLRTSLGVGPQ